MQQPHEFPESSLVFRFWETHDDVGCVQLHGGVWHHDDDSDAHSAISKV